MTDVRIDRLEKQVRRLTVALVGAIGIVIGAAMMGASLPSSGDEAVYQGSAAGAPGDGFVAVPTSSGWHVLTKESNIVTWPLPK
jgi:hypothetical protein